MNAVLHTPTSALEVEVVDESAREPARSGAHSCKVAVRRGAYGFKAHDRNEMDKDTARHAVY